MEEGRGEEGMGRVREGLGGNKRGWDGRGGVNHGYYISYRSIIT